MSWILTASGVKFDLVNTSEDMVNIEDIATALSRTVRFSGHSLKPYTVAEHCIIGANNMTSHELAFEFLLHDATEAYLGDMSSPLKGLCRDYKVVEKRLDAVIRRKFGLPEKMSPEVKLMDERMFAAEWIYLMPSERVKPDFQLADPVESLYYVSCGDIRRDFLDMFWALKGSA